VTPLKFLLVVEDDHDIRVSLRFTLEAEGYFVATCTNGRDALTMMNGFTPDLVILDMHLPLVTGAEFLESVSLVPEFREVPILTISAYEAKAREAAAAFLPKPFTIEHLLETVSSCLEQKRSA
jgi:CheY-like chemotaxis protein